MSNNSVKFFRSISVKREELPQILCHYLYPNGSVPSKRSGTLGLKLREALKQVALTPEDQAEDPQTILDAVMFEHRSSLRAKGIKAMFFLDNQLQVCVSGEQRYDSEYVREALREYNMDRFLEGPIVVKHFYHASLFSVTVLALVQLSPLRPCRPPTRMGRLIVAPLGNFSTHPRIPYHTPCRSRPRLAREGR